MEIDSTSNINININDNKFDLLTLEYLTNDSIYNKIKNTNTFLNITKEEKRKWKKELKFYRHRILDYTKKFIKNKGECDNEDDTLNQAFYIYVSRLILYFKKIDMIDTLQDDYLGINKLENVLNNDNEETKIEEDNTSFEKNEEVIEKANEIMKNVKKIPVNLDSFVIKTKNKSKEQVPIKKEINLQDPKFKKKGIQTKIKEENIISN